MEMERDYLMDVLIRTGAVCSCFEVNEHPEIEAMPHIKKISNILPGARKELRSIRARNAELEAEVGRLKEALENIASHEMSPCYELTEDEQSIEINGYLPPDSKKLQGIAKQALSQKAGDRQLCEDQNGNECTVREAICDETGENTCCLVCRHKKDCPITDICGCVYGAMEGGGGE